MIKRKHDKKIVSRNRYIIQIFSIGYDKPIGARIGPVNVTSDDGSSEEIGYEKIEFYD